LDLLSNSLDSYARAHVALSGFTLIPNAQSPPLLINELVKIQLFLFHLSVRINKKKMSYNLPLESTVLVHFANTSSS
jgi:hypothetical protein